MTVKRLEPYAVTIFAETSALAARVGAVNLGQGFPDEDGPAAMLKTAENAIAEGVNQYPPGLGIAPETRFRALTESRHSIAPFDKRISRSRVLVAPPTRAPTQRSALTSSPSSDSLPPELTRSGWR